MKINEAINNLKHGKCIPYKHETLTMAIKSLEAWGKVRAVIKKLADDEWNKKVGSASQGLEDALEIIDNHLLEVSE